jgi:hypothetical protein
MRARVEYSVVAFLSPTTFWWCWTYASVALNGRAPYGSDGECTGQRRHGETTEHAPEVGAANDAARERG